ncbi:MAG: low molecular weight protein arginine phosphatase [Clostridia bacterium]
MHILFVCTGNTCRSAMAETMFRAAAYQAKLRISTSSAGLCALEGAPASAFAQCAMTRRGLNLAGHRARLFVSDMAAHALVLCMTEQQVNAVRQRAPHARVFSIAQFVGTGSDVPDPFGGDETVYDACAEVLAQQMQLVLYRISQSDTIR